jgi:chemotaxis protein MotA
MKAATAIGIGLACAGILGAAVMEGVNPASLINIPAALIVFLGTGGACLAACGMDAMKRVPALYKKAIGPEPLELRPKVTELVGFAEMARKDGLLALESEVEGVQDAFTRKGLQLVVDGTDPDVLREILEGEIEAMEARHKVSAGVFEKAGGFAPTMGIIGTVLSLVHVLSNLSAPETLGPLISSAFIATLFGVGSANLVFLPVGNRLSALSMEESELRWLVVEGIIAIQSGDNPRVVSEKLLSYVPPSAREEAPEGAESPAGAAAPIGEPVPA